MIIISANLHAKVDSSEGRGKTCGDLTVYLILSRYLLKDFPFIDDASWVRNVALIFQLDIFGDCG